MYIIVCVAYSKCSQFYKLFYISLHRMKSRVAHHIKQLEALVDTLSDHMRVKAMIELCALRLIGYQTQVYHCIHPCS